MWAFFRERFAFDRRPKQAVAFDIQPGLKNLPRDVVEAAIAAGKAERREAPRKTNTDNPAA